MESFRVFPDTRQKMFGREPDILYLLQRVQQKGLTAVAGRPKMGKTWLLEETGRRLEQTGFLVGYHECKSESDHILLTVRDLYARWLHQAGNMAQAQSLWERHKADLITGAGKLVGKLFSFGASKVMPAGVSDMVEGAFNFLHESNQDLQTGGETIQTLPYDQVFKLISMLDKIEKKPIVLILDAWEQSVTLDAEYGVLKAFLAHLAEWPRCHVLLGVRPQEIKVSDATDHGYELAKDLEQSLPGTASIYLLPEMHLDNATEKHNLAAYLRTNLKAASGLEDNDLFQMMQGFPGVLNYWLSDIQRAQMQGKNDLVRVAADAQAYRYRDFDVLLPALSKGERIVAIRLALMPRLNQAPWLNFKDIILDGLDDGDEIVLELNIKRVLEGGNYPTYGHETRHSAARRCFLANQPLQTILVRETAGLIFRLAGRVQDASDSTVPNVVALVNLAEFFDKLPLADSVRVVVASAASLMEAKFSWPDFQKLSAALQDLSEHHPSALALTAMGLFNMLVESETSNNLSRRDALLQALSALAQANPAESAVRQWLANGLLNTSIDAKARNDLSRREVVLQELRLLAQANPTDVAVSEPLAKVLFNTLNSARAKNDPNRCDALLQELRLLAQANPASGPVRQQLSDGLFNTFYDTTDKNNPSRRQALLQELRSLAQTHPQEVAVQQLLARAVFKMLEDAQAEKDLSQRNGSLEELRSLAQTHSPEGAAQKLLARGLFNTLNYAKLENDLPRRDALLEELRLLAQAHPADGTVREWLAKGLFNSLLHATEENDLPRRDALLQELRSLALAPPANGAVREQLAKGLFKTQMDAKAENDPSRRDTLRQELASLVKTYPNDEWVNRIPSLTEA